MDQRHLLLLVLVPLFACDILDPAVCTTEARPGIVISAVDATTGVPVSDTLFAVFSEGSFVEEAKGLEGVVAGVYERAGTYDVVVDAEGYLQWARQGVSVSADDCHVRTEELTAELESS